MLGCTMPTYPFPLPKNNGAHERVRKGHRRLLSRAHAGGVDAVGAAPRVMRDDRGRARDTHAVGPAGELRRQRQATYTSHE